MEKLIVKYCNNILNNEKITSMKIINFTNIDKNYINNFYEKFPQYKDTIIIRYINNCLLIFDKKYIKEIEDKVFLSIQKKCTILKKKNELVDVLDIKVHNIDELKLIIDDYSDIDIYKEEFDFSAEKDGKYYFISIMNLAKYNENK